ncbi:MAG: RDD family protein [Scytolyngbya sp. HA4215-MV1]|jgi:uncharacterized RDD family membrane protein YckC|nr:RDD family protein [Scytolyngbya sp. HA4215-MV1]
MHFFNRVTLSTPESVELELTLAGIGNRALALMIDYLIWGSALFIFWMAWLFFFTQLGQYLDKLGINYNNISNWLVAILFLITFVIWVGYFVCFETLWQGQTPGKRVAKIRVVRDDGRPITLAQAALRALLRPIDDTFFIGFFFIVLGQREKRIGDWVAGTLVIQETRPIHKATVLLSEKAQPLAEALLQIANFSPMLPDDFAVIREYLQRRSLMSAKAKSEVSLKLARQLKELIVLEQLPAEMTADLFLEAVYLAYQQQENRPES